MAKSKEKKPRPKAPEHAPTVIAIKKDIEARMATLAKCQKAATKDGKLNKLDPKVREALKRLKRTQRKLDAEAFRLRIRNPEKIAAAAAAAAEAATKAAAAETAAKAAAAAAAPAAEAAPAAAAAEGEKKA